MYNITYMVAQDMTLFVDAYKNSVGNLSQREVFKIVDYDCTTERRLNERGVPYDSSVKILFHLTIDIGRYDASMYFYDALSSRSLLPFTLLFCRTASSGESQCSNAAVLEGYVTRIHESFQTIEGEPSLYLGVDVLVRKFNFIEEENNLKAFQSIRFNF